MKSRKGYMSWGAIVVVVTLMVGLFAWSAADSRKKLAELQIRDEKLAADVQLLQISIQDLRAQLQRVGTDGHAQNALREQHGYILDGEVIFCFQYPELLERYTNEEYLFILDAMR